MSRRGHTSRAALLGSLLLALVPGTAWAYLDPGTTSMIVQLVLGGVAGLVVAGKLYWQRILVLLRLRQPEDAPEAENDPGTRAP